MELRQLESFIAVAEELHFGRAAVRIHLSQPALSQQIKRLEDDLGFVLLERTQRRVELTAAGATFLDHARRLLHCVDQMVADASLVASGHLGTLSIGYVGASLFSVVPRVIRDLRLEAPHIALSLSERKTAEQLTELRAGHLDAGFIHTPRGPVPEDLDMMRLFTENVGIALPEGHRLGSSPAIALTDLAAVPFVMFPRLLEPDTHDHFVRACALAGFIPDVAQEATSLQTVLGLVAAGLGVAFVAESVMDNSHRQGITYHRLTGEPPTVTTALTWLRANANPSIEILAKIAADHAVLERPEATRRTA